MLMSFRILNVTPELILTNTIAVDMIPLKKNGASPYFQGSISIVPDKRRSKPSENQRLFLRRKKNHVQVQFYSFSYFLVFWILSAILV